MIKILWYVKDLYDAEIKTTSTTENEKNSLNTFSQVMYAMSKH